MLIPQWQMKNPIRSDTTALLRNDPIVISGFARRFGQIDRLQKQFCYVLHSYLVCDTQRCDGLIELPDAVRTSCGDHPRTGPHSLFDPDLSKTFFAGSVLPRPAAAAATAEAPLPIVLHFNQRHPRDRFKDSPGRI